MSKRNKIVGWIHESIFQKKPDGSAYSIVEHELGDTYIKVIITPEADYDAMIEEAAKYAALSGYLPSGDNRMQYELNADEKIKAWKRHLRNITAKSKEKKR